MISDDCFDVRIMFTKWNMAKYLWKYGIELGDITDAIYC